MKDTETLKSLFELAQELYAEGYMCGGDSDEWMMAWAKTMLSVARGEKYNTSNSVTKNYAQ